MQFHLLEQAKHLPLFVILHSLSLVSESTINSVDIPSISNSLKKLLRYIIDKVMMKSS